MLREANQAGNLQPTTLVSCDADIERVFDCREDAALRAPGLESATLANPTWRHQMNTRGEARIQALAHRIAAAGYHGLLVRNFAPGVTCDDLNLVLWTWGTTAPSRLKRIDDEDRLTCWRQADHAQTGGVRRTLATFGDRDGIAGALTLRFCDIVVSTRLALLPALSIIPRKPGPHRTPNRLKKRTRILLPETGRQAPESP